jgi:thiol-disulfide isomerase/thioredoxin
MIRIRTVLLSLGGLASFAGLAALVIFAAVAVATAAPANDARPVPDLALIDGAGQTVRLADLKGRVVLVDFWASWCVPCRASFPALDALQRDFADRGLVVLAVNVDEDRRNADGFLAARPHTMRVIFDAKGRAAEAFELKGMPSSFLIDRTGRVRFTHMGYTEKTIAQYRGEVLQLLGEPR